MKARIKSTGETVDIVRFDHKSLTFFTRDGNEYYPVDLDRDIDIPQEPDWQAYRMEVAKECMASYLGGLNDASKVDMLKSETVLKASVDCFARLSIMCADALIARLQEQKGE